MKLKRYWRRGMGLAVLGVALAAFALIKLNATPDISESIAFAPVNASAAQAPGGGDNAQTPEKTPTALETLIKRYDSVKGDAVKALPNAALYAYANGAGLAGDAGQSQSGTLTAVDKGYFETYNKLLCDGYWFTDAQLASGDKVAVLDELLAFKLFPTTLATQGSLIIGAEEYKVIGVVRRQKSAGDVDEYGAYVPLRALASAENSGMQYVVLAARTEGNAGLSRVISETAKLALGDSVTSFDLSKENMRAQMLLRVLAVLFLSYALMFILRRLNARAMRALKWLGKQLKYKYFVSLLPVVCALVLSYGALYALWLGGGYFTLKLVLDPMYVFTEWVPDVIVEWSSVSGRAKELMIAAAQPVKLQTANVAALRLYGKLLNAGLILALCAGTLIGGRNKRAARKPK